MRSGGQRGEGVGDEGQRRGCRRKREKGEKRQRESREQRAVFTDDIISVASRRVLLLAHWHAPLLTWNLDPRLELELISQCWIRNLNGAEAWPSLPRCPSPSFSLSTPSPLSCRVIGSDGGLFRSESAWAHTARFGIASSTNHVQYIPTRRQARHSVTCYWSHDIN